MRWVDQSQEIPASVWNAEIAKLARRGDRAEHALEKARLERTIGELRAGTGNYTRDDLLAVARKFRALFDSKQQEA